MRLLAFAQAQDQLGFREQMIECMADESPRTILARIAPMFRLDAMRVAVDCEYHPWDAPIGNTGEIALIPPVSGG